MLFEAFQRNLRERPDEAAFMIAAGDRSLPISWRRFADDISAVSWVIRRYSPGAVIGLMGENSYEWITAHAACLFSGVCVIPVDINLSAEETAARLKRVGAKTLGYSSLYEEKALKVHQLLPDLTLGGFGSFRSDELLSRAREALAGGEKGVFELPPPDTEKTSMIMFTSGTTSEPRGVELTVGGIECFCRNVHARIPMRGGERSLMLLPVQHIFGICAAYAMLAAGVSLGVCPDYRRLYDAAERFRADFIFMVPALADILAAKMERRRGLDGVDALCVRWICIGGAPMSPRTAERLSELGIKVLAAYGLTETTALYSLSDFSKETEIGSAGEVCALEEVETKVSGDGELMIRGPNVFIGYYREPELTAAVKDADGWFRTGDIGRIDSGGRVWITGRASRTIVLSSGKKVAPEELEAKILMYPAVREVVVRGDGEKREIIAEIYSERPEGEVHGAISSLNSSLPVYMRVKRVVCRNKPFPRTASGKIALPRSTRRKTRRNWPLIICMSILLFAVAASFQFWKIPHEMLPGDEPAPRWLRELMEKVEVWGKILLAGFAFVLALFAYRGTRRRRR